MTWLARGNVRDHAEKTVAELRKQIKAEEASSGGHPGIVDIVSGRNKYQRLSDIHVGNLVAGNEIQQQWFCDSICVVWPEDGERETIYFTKAPIAVTFCQFGVYHWTHWLHSLTKKLQECLDANKNYPKLLMYDPP